MKQDKQKLRAQVKSRFYYYFWGIATIAVVFGQLYVGTGYRILPGHERTSLQGRWSSTT